MTIREAARADAAALADLDAALERPSLPDEWDDWADEPHRTLVAEEDGRLIGAAHAAMVGLSEGWVEGLRVRPEVRRRGVARALQDAALGVIRAYGGAVARTAVPAHDYAALSLAERLGYERVASYDVLVGDAGGAAEVPYEAEVHAADRREAGEVLRLVREALAGHEGLVPLGWRFRTLKDEMVLAMIREERVLAAGSDVAAAALVTDRGETLVVNAMAGETPGLRALAGALGERARERGQTRLAAFLPRPSPAFELLRARGFAPHAWCPDGLAVVELALRRAADVEPAAAARPRGERGGRNGARRDR